MPLASLDVVRPVQMREWNILLHFQFVLRTWLDTSLLGGYESFQHFAVSFNCALSGEQGALFGKYGAFSG